MRFIKVGEFGQETPAVEVDGRRLSLSSITADIDGAFLSNNPVAVVEQALAAGELEELDAEARLGSPIATPGKIVCVGLNYRDHAAETNAEVPKEPVVFMKDPSTIVGPFDDVYIPRNSVKTDWEVELGVVIGAEARYLESPEAARASIAGYVLSHDVSEREFQLERGGQWDKGKSCERFNPLGPVLVTPEEIADPGNLNLRLSVNGVLHQNGNTKNLIFGIEYVIWYLSQFMVLRPGDLINTGTPAGVALGIEGNPYLRPGDVVELSIEGLGSSKQLFVAAP
ncbi:2-keto-4-pentenoate hydratase/2-oxohepta-3-ene-1,7-dioic acid hydratase in catechol pathway [Leucobacter exalbidus]|uniref:2-keto-4-pentenoate hydratase/2-oxohepta-3-ene-1,7-dioic acid hydratase in catechol pathway n=1 Tax=Leucobacter exalbidus TaxID=662960 RepID=A0A940PNA7_9MICO|nr:fumarylacetoacetate hydrolase family protein [Leucobacter exalbidus]MBP1326303.1 2-keto-4-pentenoate hydratase/2-oxohepta-3-ene-1,7-dioic acid hydratase in catechol pathway [Leucobacter exalbidus]